MDNGLDLLFKRRSIRRYTDEAISREQMETILKAAMAAPSAGNRQPWSFVVTTNQQTRERLAEFLPYGKMLPGAPVCLAVCGDLQKGYSDPTMTFWVQDCAAATQNALLAATALGLGSVWLGIYPSKDRVDRVAALLGTPEHLVPFGLIALGHPAETKEPGTKYNPDLVRWLD